MSLLRRERLWFGLMASFVAALAFFYLRFVLVSSIDHDEVEHVHVGFRMLEGLVPYRDFYQNHWPAYWLVTQQFVQMFPFSVHSILAGRVVSTLALTGSWLFGFLWLRQFRGGRTWLARLVYTWVVILVAYLVQFYVARPDPIMTLFATAGLCLIPAQGNIKSGRALLLGALFGIAASVSTKIAPVAIVVPAVIAIHCIRDRSPRPGIAWLPYGFGVVLGILPTALWISHNGLFAAFYFDVFKLNLALSVPWQDSFMFLHVPVYLAAVLGTMAWLSDSRYASNREKNGSIALALALASGVALSFLARHSGVYNLQVLTIPVAIGFSNLAVVLWFRTRGLGYRLVLIAALLAYPTTHLGMPLVRIDAPSSRIEQGELQEIMDLARPGDRSCIAFAPSHPVFCHDVSVLANSWDLKFVRGLSDPRQLERFHRIWREGIEATLERPPDILLRRDPERVWKTAVNLHLITRAELMVLNGLRPNYEVKQIGRYEVWVRNSE